MVQDLTLQDSVQQRLDKMMRSPAKKMLSLSMGVQNGASTKKMEMINLMSQQHSAPMKKWNHQLVLLQNGSPQHPQHVCISSEMKVPYASRAAAGFQIAREALPAELTSQVYNGHSQQSAHAMTFKAKAEMSPERKQRLQASSANPIYDRFNIEVESLKPVSPIVEKLVDVGHHYLYPSFDTPSLQQGSLSKMASIQATRSLRNDRMNLRYQSRNHVSSRSGIKVPQMIDQIVLGLRQ